MDVEIMGPATFTVALEGDAQNPFSIELTERGLGSASSVSKYQVYLPPGSGEVTVHLTDTAHYQIKVTNQPKGPGEPKDPKEIKA